jgi:hypothetical protein
LAITILIGSCDEIANQFIADEAIKNMKILQENGMHVEESARKSRKNFLFALDSSDGETLTFLEMLER